MTTKKKSPAAPAAKPAASPRGPAIAPGANGPEQPNPASLQFAAFQEGIRLFTARDFTGACEAFARAAQGPAADIADKARSYLQICERKTSKPDLQFRTAEDHFNYGVERLNARDIEQARFHLGRALDIQPDADHILYTMALSCGLAGDSNAACENLKRAIEIEPRNRILARQDPDFTALANQYPALRSLME